ncbi:helix-turn-helix domain-containing protein [Streptomyces sp. HNM0574]|uniref:helix-turn-helix domain-containing protein n=1 Tax=Streptomyces sp. HNM0574 TaxID=2714954 RepID=UPI001F0F0C0F|nr:helix-turn-helix domain-containing protein [Streptomyces sp. HNM0574]
MSSTGQRQGPPGPGELAELLEDLKRRSGRSYAALAHRTGLSGSTLHRYCRGTTVPPSFGAIERIARVSGATRQELDQLFRAWSRTAAGERGTEGTAPEPEPVPVPEARPGPGAPCPPAPLRPVPRQDGVRALRPYAWLRLAALMAVLALTTVSSGMWAQRPGGTETGRETADGRVTGSGATGGAGERQRPEGPYWGSAPRPVESAFFGMSLSDDQGRMPSFRVGSVRLWESGTRWSLLEPERGVYRWATLDRLVRAAERRGLPVLFTIGGTPPWAAPDGAGSAYRDAGASPPDDLRDWDRFVTRLVTRYRGRIEAYELWDYPSHRLHYAGGLGTLAEMVERAAGIIRDGDPLARVVCPSFGALWTEQGRERLREFVRTGAYDHCDVAALKMPPRRPDGRPEDVIELTRVVNRLFFEEEQSELELWNTGPDRSVALAPPLGAARARGYAPRYYLAGLYASDDNLTRGYFYAWGSADVPLVVQLAGGPPTEAGLRMGRLAEWLDGAGITACGQGMSFGLPKGVYSCTFVRDGSTFAVRWSARGPAATTADAGVHRVRSLDGTARTVRPGERVVVDGDPVAFDYRRGATGVRG